MSEKKNNFFGKRSVNEGEKKNNFSFAAEEKNNEQAEEQKKKKSKKELLKEIKAKKKKLVEELKAKEEKLDLNIEYIELSLEELDLAKDVYLATYRNRKRNLKNKYYKAFTDENGGKLE